jgi:hypothetical protein
MSAGGTGVPRAPVQAVDLSEIWQKQRKNSRLAHVCFLSRLYDKLSGSNAKPVKERQLGFEPRFINCLEPLWAESHEIAANDATRVVSGPSEMSNKPGATQDD